MYYSSYFVSPISHFMTEHVTIELFDPFDICGQPRNYYYSLYVLYIYIVVFVIVVLRWFFLAIVQNKKKGGKAKLLVMPKRIFFFIINSLTGPHPLRRNRNGTTGPHYFRVLLVKVYHSALKSPQKSTILLGVLWNNEDPSFCFYSSWVDVALTNYWLSEGRFVLASQAV